MSTRALSGSGILAAALIVSTLAAHASNAIPISAWASLGSEIAANLAGGIAQGARVDHKFQVGFALQGGSLGLPSGGRFHATFQLTHSGAPSASLVGDAQGFSNIVAPSRATLYALWYAQHFDANHWTVRLGLISADNYFDDVYSASTLINSSFGVQPTWSGNTVAPIYPTAGLGAMATWKGGAWSNRVGLFQADPAHRGSLLHRGALWMDEVAYRAATPGASTYKFGLWRYRSRAPHSRQGAARYLPAPTWGMYFSVEHPVSRSARNSPIVFFRVGWSPNRASAVPVGIQTGILVDAPLPDRPNDQFSAGIARVRLRGLGEETAYEVTYVVTFSSHFDLQPDIQYIEDPGGRYPSATVFTLRAHVGFSE